jgi:hypothetical protein
VKDYKIAFLISALAISLPSAFLVVVGVVNLSATHILFWGGVLFVWWFAFWNLRQGVRRSFGLTFLLVNVFWWPLLARTAQRVLFVLENGGMERSDGYGSPLAFLIGLVGEQAFFLPLTATLFFGCMVLIRSNKQPQATQEPRA